MKDEFKQIASLIGDPVRATVMWTLLDGKAFTATELSIAADTSPQNLSMHLTRLVQAGLLCVERQGRHRYYKFSRKEIAYAIEAMTNLIPNPGRTKNEEFDMSPIRYCRTCYDHLAGKIGVLITNSLLQQKIIINKNNNFEVTAKGRNWFLGLDIHIDILKEQRRFFIRPCLDWSERRYHIAGSLAAALLDKMLSSDWLRKTKGSRAVIITGKGEKKLHDHFKISL